MKLHVFKSNTKPWGGGGNKSEINTWDIYARGLILIWVIGKGTKEMAFK